MPILPFMTPDREPGEDEGRGAARCELRLAGDQVLVLDGRVLELFTGGATVAGGSWRWHVDLVDLAATARPDGGTELRLATRRGDAVLQQAVVHAPADEGGRAVRGFLAAVDRARGVA